MKDDILSRNIKNWTLKNLGTSFVFRQYQLEAVYTICSNILSQVENQIIEAPTGSGKSLIILISAGVLSEFYGLKSYILCSDLMLWQQYSDVIKGQNLPFGTIKGSVNNYLCSETGEDLSVAPCRLRQVSFAELCNPQKAQSYGLECASSCEYINERKKAIKAPVTLMPYQLYGLMQFDANDSNNNAYSFTYRPIVFCDECHKIPNIAQTFVNPVFDFENDYEKLKAICDFARSNNRFIIGWENKEMKFKMIDAFKRLCNIKDGISTKREIYNAFCDYIEYTIELESTIQDIAEYFKECSIANKALTPDELKVRNLLRWFSDYYEVIYNYLRCIRCGSERRIIESFVLKKKAEITKHSVEFIVKTVLKNNKDNKETVVMKYAKEDLLSQMFILGKSQYKVMLSATIGEQQSFENNIGINWTQSQTSYYQRIPSTFDFSKSPIYYLPKYKMTKDLIDENMIHMADLISTIVSSEKHNNVRGIIHTGSYKNAKSLYDLLPSDIQERIIIYSNSREKEEKIDEYLSKPNAILIGPTLTEGIDMPDDGCRFIIIMKVPFPYLGDELVRAKNQLFPTWYNTETSNHIIQGIGRGNRHIDDWCVTYILDGSFKRLYESTKSQYPFEMQSRIVEVSSVL